MGSYLSKGTPSKTGSVGDGAHGSAQAVDVGTINQGLSSKQQIVAGDNVVTGPVAKDGAANDELSDTEKIHSQYEDVYHPHLLFFDFSQAVSNPEDYYWPLKVINLSAMIGFINGFWLGASHRSVQFLAENAHRQPRTRAGWYLYQRTKHQEVMSVGISRGVGLAAKLCGFASVFLGFEKAGEMLLTNGEQSPLNPMMSAVLSTMVLSKVMDFDVPYTLRILRVGLLGALAYTTIIECYTFSYGASPKIPDHPKKRSFYVPYEFGPSPQVRNLCSNVSSIVASGTHGSASGVMTRLFEAYKSGNLLKDTTNQGGVNLVKSPSGFFIPVYEKTPKVTEAPETA